LLLLYYITDRMQLGESEAIRRALLMEKIASAARAGVDYIQLRERDLPARALQQLAAEAVAAVRAAKSSSKVLINSRIDVAIAAGADGVHLRSDDIAASDARAVWAKAAGSANCTIGVSCHSLEEVLRAEAHGADFAVLGPVFGKTQSNVLPLGVEAIAQAVHRGAPADPKVEAGQTLRMPVIALGGVTIENTAECVRAGAAGVAGIRLFQQGEIADTVKRMKAAA
jgi:thiamine-phosphate pyrophosphorylase